MSDSTNTLGAPWPAVLQTGRLLLRPVQEDDLPVLVELWQDPRVRRHLGGPVSPAKAEARKARYVGAPGAFAVVLATGGPAIGLVTVEADGRGPGTIELSYQLLPAHWNQGVGTEAVAAVLDWTEAAGQTRSVVAVTQHANTPSRRLLESLGLTMVDTVTEYGELQAVYTRTKDA
ncbi:GNAT family N-acetyltransferase [Kitasatospora purpeofusca]|uniref:GNAT family N-acetyltransferase n=1 Tax=Kitasatospora purpeofusca TaxID=67352 RepID=UPI00369F265F